MATDKLTEIRKQMAALEKEEAKLLKKNRTAALKEIKRLVTTYKLSALDLASVTIKSKRGPKPGTTGKKRGPKPGTTGKKRGPKPGTTTTTGARRGRKPKAKATTA